MTVQTVPYALQNASHSAALFRQSASAAFVTGGSLGSGELAVSQQSTPNMSVVLGAGRAKVPGTSVSPPSGFAWTTQAMYDVLNDANLTLTIATSSPTLPRIDTVYVQVQDSFYSGTNNQAIAGVVTGTPASSPTPPAWPTNSIPIAYIAVAANASTIVTANISSQVTVAQVLTPTNQGLTSIIPTSVAAPSGGTVTVGTNGVITATAAGAVSVNGCFTSRFDNYLIVYDVPSKSAAAALQWRLRLAGTDASGGSDYVYQLTVSQGSSVAGSGASASAGYLQSTAALANSGEITFFAPALARVTRWNSSDEGVVNSTTAQYLTGGGQHAQAVAYDGISIIAGSGTITGTFRIYGYNNN